MRWATEGATAHGPAAPVGRRVDPELTNARAGVGSGTRTGRPLTRPSSRRWRGAAGLLAGLLVGAARLAGQDVGTNPDWTAAIAEFERTIEADVAADDVGGISAAVVRGSDVVWARGFGWADRDHRIPAGVGSIYRTGSISKTFTAVVMMQAVERGFIELDQPLRSAFPAAGHFPDARPGTDPPTFRQFASHTAGIVREPAWDSAASGVIEIWEERIVESIRRSAFQAAPGQEYSYSNIAYGTLGLAVARATGRPFMELVEQDVFEPLGMTNSTFIIDDELAPKLTVGYANEDDGIDAAFPAREHAGRGYKVPNGGVYSTVTDLARFMGSIGGSAPKAILSDESRQEMMRVQTPEDPNAGYGLGLMVRKSPAGDWLVGHSGSVAGYNAYMVFEPETGLGVVMLRNYLPGETNLGQASQALLVRLLEAVE